MEDKIKELLKKIKALADKGVGGEKINAEKILHQQLKKHNLTIADIEGEKKSDYYLNIKEEDFKLFNQIAKKVNRDIPAYKFPAKEQKQYKLKGNYMITATASEYIEIESMYNIYSRLYKEEMDVFYSAFCRANNLLADARDEEKKSLSDFSPEEYEKWKRTEEIARKIKTEQYRKQLS